MGNVLGCWKRRDEGIGGGMGRPLLLRAVLGVMLAGTAVWAHPDADVADELDAELISHMADVDEVESNDSAATAQDLTGEFSLDDDDVYAVRVDGSLADSADVDFYRVAMAQEGQINLHINLLEVGHESFTHLALGSDDSFFLVCDGMTLWRYDSSEDEVSLLAGPTDLAGAVSGMSAEEAAIADIVAWADDAVLVALAGQGGLVRVRSSGAVTQVVTADEISAETGSEAVDLVSVAVDSSGNVYLADEATGSVLVCTGSFGGLEYYAAGTAIGAALKSELVSDLEAGVTSIPETDLAVTYGVFKVTSLLWVPAGGLYEEGFYTSQFSEANGGDGSITRVIPNEEDPEEASLIIVHLPEDDEEIDEDDMNFTALALAQEDNTGFEGKLFVGNFGFDMGNEFDGHVYQVEPEGTISDFVTAYVDGEGGAFIKKGSEVTGFYDVIDMAFSPGGASVFGNYLYVISENIDDNSAGGSASDIWRIDADGVAQMFVEEIVDGAGSLAFDTEGSYGGDLYVATWQSNSKILRLTSEGAYSTFYEFGGSEQILDMAFAPAGSLFAGELLVMAKRGSGSSLIAIDPSGETKTVWSTGIATGDIPSGDFVFDPEGHLVYASSSTKAITRLDYENLFEYQLEDIQVRERLSDTSPYVLLSLADQPRIVTLGQKAVSSDIATEVSPSDLDVGTVPDDESKNVAFCFSDYGSLFVFIQNRGRLYSAAREFVADSDAEDGVDDSGYWFDNFSTVMYSSQIYNALALKDVRMPALAISPSGVLYAAAGNGIKPEDVVDSDNEYSQVLDDVVLGLGNVNQEDYEPEAVLGAGRVNMIRIDVEGPGGYQEAFMADMEAVWSDSTGSLAAGTYTVSLSGPYGVSGGYQMIVDLGNVDMEYVLEAGQGPLELVTTADQRLRLSLTGGGQAVLETVRRPVTGKVSECVRLSLEGTGRNSVLDFSNLDEPGNLFLESIVVDRPMSSLTCEGSVDQILAAGTRRTAIRTMTLEDVREVNLPLGSVGSFSVANLGDEDFDPTADIDGDGEDDILVCDFYRVNRIAVSGDVNQVRLLHSGSRNNYQEIRIGGVLNDTTIFGNSIGRLLVENEDLAESAIAGSAIYLARSLNMVLVSQGDIDGSNLTAESGIGWVQLNDGSLRDTVIEVSSVGWIGQVKVLSAEETAGNTLEPGNIIGSALSGGRRIITIHADGQMTSDVSISASVSIAAGISRITCGGHCGATINTSKMGELWVGYDCNRHKLPEDDLYTGSDFTGSISAYKRIGRICATGSMGGTIQCVYGSVGGVFAEDGFDASLSCRRVVGQVMVGFVNGNIRNIANGEADVSGSISARRLARLYYTGDLDMQMSLPTSTGPVVHIDGP